MDSTYEEINSKRLSLYQQLFLYGDYQPLSFKIDFNQLDQELEKFHSDWIVYNKHKGETGRVALSVTSLDGGLSGEPDLQSLKEYSERTGKIFSENDFNKPTDVYKNCSSLHEILNYFTGGLGRCRLVKFKKGGFFPPHRDLSLKYQVPDYFRIFVPLQNCGENSLYFIYEDKKVKYEVGRAYLFNALKTHSVFSFADDTVTLAISLQLNNENIKAAINALQVR